MKGGQKPVNYSFVGGRDDSLGDTRAWLGQGMKAGNYNNCPEKYNHNTDKGMWK